MEHSSGMEIVIGVWTMLLAAGGAVYWISEAWQLLTKRLSRKTMATH